MLSALISVCLMTLSGCNTNAQPTSTGVMVVEKRMETKRPPAIKAVMCTLPADNTALWGDNVVYKEKVRRSLAECNSKNQRTNEMNAKL
ncbi:Rz1-like lysis system protein LysC [Xenorhabdus khoisanae]|uniref:Rz1-like lysis system protein LysC n=1 Tax=Xenorhabdus khoisanae TaxID=880157 RepID=UPI003BB60A49